MNWLDWATLAVVGVNALQGLVQGFIRTALSLVGGVLGLFLASRLYSTLAERLFNSDSALARIAAFALIFLAVALFFSLIARLIRKGVSLMMLGWADRVVGLVLGAFLGAVVAGAALALLAKLGWLQGSIQESRLAALLLEKFPLLMALLPDEFDVVKSLFQ